MAFKDNKLVYDYTLVNTILLHNYFNGQPENIFYLHNHIKDHFVFNKKIQILIMEHLSVYEYYDDDVFEMFKNQLKQEKKTVDLFDYRKIFYNIGRTRGIDYTLFYFNKIKEIFADVRKNLIYSKNNDNDMNETEKQLNQIFFERTVILG